MKTKVMIILKKKKTNAIAATSSSIVGNLITIYCYMIYLPATESNNII